MSSNTAPAAVLAVLATVFVSVAAQSAETKRPNILWISCEDISPHLGCYGDPHAITPTLDKLAADGVRYANAFTVAPVCAPNRSGIITGMYPPSIGAHHMRCKTTLPEHVKCFPAYLRQAGYYCTNNSKTDYNFGWSKGEVWDGCSNKAHWRGRNEGQPFFAVFNLTTTHEGRIRAGDDSYAALTKRLTPDQRQDPAKLTTLPPYYPDTPVTRRDWARYYELITAMDYQSADLLKQLDEDGLAEDTIVFFWSDHGVGLPRAKRWLYDSGTHVPLIVRIPEKYRPDGQGKPGTVDGQLVSSLDFAPTVLNLAGLPTPKHMQGRAFLGPNLTEPREYVISARDRMDERYDMIRSVRDKRYRYIRNFEWWKPYFQYMNTPEGGPTMQELRRLHAAGTLPPEAEQFMADCKPREELYDLENDPHEVHNLADSVPEHRKILLRMREGLERQMLQTGDLGFFPEPEIAARTEELGSAWAILHQPGGQSLFRLVAVMAIAAGKAADDPGLYLPALKAALADTDAAVRYWGAMGLGNAGRKAREHADELQEALDDPSPSVRVAAARAVCLMGLEEKALPVLVRELASDRQWVRLNAALVLDEIDEKARPAVETMQKALADKNKYVARVVNRALNELLGTDNKVR